MLHMTINPHPHLNANLKTYLVKEKDDMPIPKQGIIVKVFAGNLLFNMWRKYGLYIVVIPSL